MKTLNQDLKEVTTPAFPRMEYRNANTLYLIATEFGGTESLHDKVKRLILDDEGVNY